MSDNNVVMNNTILNNVNGIWMYKAQYNTIKGNTVSDSINKGIHMDTYSQHNTVVNNYIENNGEYGIHIDGTTSGSNKIYNNYLHNTNNAYDEGNNQWNVAKIAGKNIVGGAWLGGNYWSDYYGTDTDGDGLGDTNLPYNCNGNIQNGGDMHPLVTRAVSYTHLTLPTKA